ncbi:MAG TPA: ABC transporter permease [Anaerovoracaceae bacterium]|nr:ABC transporter permease [Anaerovoracaceae bacterium]
MKIVLWILAAAFLAGLLITALFVSKLDCEDLLLIVPVSSNSSEINAEPVEEKNGESFLLTYEILSKKTLRALHSNYDVTVIETNYTHPYIVDYNMKSGSFFTEADQKRKLKAVILNVTASYAMFGNLDVCGRKVIIDQLEYTVIGVLEDKDDKEADEDALCNVYLPASISGHNPEAIAIQMTGDMTAEQVKSDCKDLTVPESGYAYISCKALVDLVYGMIFIALKVVFIGILLVLLRLAYGMLRNDLRRMKELTEQLYFRELIKNYPRKTAKTAALFAVITLLGLIIMSITFSSIEFLLLWNDSVSLPSYSDSAVFGDIISTLKRNIYLSIFFLIGLILDMGLLLFFHRKFTLLR